MPRIILAKTAGSTIVELSVVIAIIASLAAMAVPTVAYRDKARITQAVGSSEGFGPPSRPMRRALAECLSFDRCDHRFQLLASCGECAWWYAATECHLLSRPL